MIKLTEDDKKGIVLVQENDCYTCHSVDKNLVGPTFESIAKKYSATEENLMNLSNKIINGGRGSWGDVPMVAHPNLSKEDAEAIVKYILLLKK